MFLHGFNDRYRSWLNDHFFIVDISLYLDDTNDTSSIPVGITTQSDTLPVSLLVLERRRVFRHGQRIDHKDHFDGLYMDGANQSPQRLYLLWR